MYQSPFLNEISDFMLSKKPIEQPLGDVSAFRRSKKQANLPAVLTQNKVKLLFEHIPFQY